MNFFSVATLLLLASSVQGFYLQSSRQYYDYFNSNIELQCGSTSWNKNSVVQFYGNGRLIFDSSSKSSFTYVRTTRMNKTVVLNSKNLSGWKDLYCKINKSKSTNSMTVPYVSGPTFQHGPAGFQPNNKYTFICEGDLKPSTATSVEFLFNGKVFAKISNTMLFTYNITGLNVFEGPYFKKSVIVQPTLPTNNGTYGCALTFNLKDNTLKGIISAGWRSDY